MMRLKGLLFIFFLLPAFLMGQGIGEEFGKNRVQYHDDFRQWWMYESENFFTYWYGKSRNVAQAAMQMAEMDYDQIVNAIEHRTNQKIEIVVYTDITDLKQSNIGSEALFSTTAGKTKIVGNKLFVYFNGDHLHLRKQIRKGVASIIIDAMLFGGNLQEIVQNAVFLNVPEWYKEGLVSFIARGWDPEIQSDLRKIMREEDEENFEKLAYNYPEEVGHAFWYFLTERYGRAVIANLLYLTRINRDLDKAFLYVVGASFESLTEEWASEFADYTLVDRDRRSHTMRPPLKVKKERQLTAVAPQPNGRIMAYATNQIGKVRVFLQERNKKRDCILKFGYCNRVQDPDLNYPILTWTPEGDRLFIIYEKRDVIRLRMVDPRTGDFEEQPIPTGIQRIYDAAALSSRELVFTANDNGFSDLFSYRPRTRQFEKLTDDYHDDLEVEAFIGGERRGVVFSSNRPNTDLIKGVPMDTVLPLGTRNIFFFDLDSKEAPIKYVTDNQVGNKKDLLMTGAGLFFLSDKSGIWNRRLINMAEVLRQDGLGGSVDFGFDGQPVTAYQDNILLHYSPQGDGGFVDIFSEEDTYAFASLQDAVIEGDLEVVGPPTEDDGKKDEDEVYDLNYFDVPFENPPMDTAKRVQEDTPVEDAIARYKDRQLQGQGRVPEFDFVKAVPSRIRFRVDHFNTNLDNSLLFGGLDTYAGTKREFENPPLGILLKANMKDIFEDYVVEGGTRITTSFNGAEHFLTLADRKNRIDKHYALYRRSVRNLIDEGEFAGFRGRNITFIGIFQARYPLDVYRSLRGSVTFRNDRFAVLSTNITSLNAPTLDEQRMGFKLEYVFDNTIEREMNILNGMRYKGYVEAVKRFALDFDPLNLDLADGFMTVAGVDVRTYVPVLRHSVYAARFHGATSFGSERILFFAGGMENWLFPSFNQGTSFPQEDNYAYQTIATNVRGFEYNIRNGGTFAILSQEFRLPIMRYLTRRKIRFAPLHHLQLSAFFDMGMAWFGNNPLASDNPANSNQFSNPAVDLNVQYYRDPLIMGYGWGVRTLIFGYYLKFDYAWGVETRNVREPVWYLSLGTDF